jgi:hypothetical protein
VFKQLGQDHRSGSIASIELGEEGDEPMHTAAGDAMRLQKMAAHDDPCAHVAMPEQTDGPARSHVSAAELNASGVDDTR